MLYQLDFFLNDTVTECLMTWKRMWIEQTRSLMMLCEECANSSATRKVRRHRVIIHAVLELNSCNRDQVWLVYRNTRCYPLGFAPCCDTSMTSILISISLVSVLLFLAYSMKNNVERVDTLCEVYDGSYLLVVIPVDIASLASRSYNFCQKIM